MQLTVISRLVRTAFVLTGAASVVLLVWLLAGWPFFFDSLLIRSDEPVRADAIVCVTGGLGANSLPTEEGVARIYTAVQLYVDGYAPVVVFSGGAGSNLSEAEVYAEVAGWLGLPADAVELAGC